MWACLNLHLDAYFQPIGDCIGEFATSLSMHWTTTSKLVWEQDSDSTVVQYMRYTVFGMKNVWGMNSQYCLDADFQIEKEIKTGVQYFRTQVSELEQLQKPASMK